jgi:hypothetical protein
MPNPQARGPPPVVCPRLLIQYIRSAPPLLEAVRRPTSHGLGDNTDDINKSKETLVDASEQVGLEVSTERTKYMLLACHQNSGQNWDIKVANRSFADMSQYKYLRMTVINLNLIQEEIKRRMNSGGT